MRNSSRYICDLPLLPPEFQIDSDSSNPDESDSSEGEDGEDGEESDSESEPSSDSDLSNPLISENNGQAKDGSSDGCRNNKNNKKESKSKLTIMQNNPVKYPQL